MDALKKYWAFLSYSHQDAKVCEWLHRELETFRVPRRLVGLDTREGKTPTRLFPVFRDRDELPGSSELGKNLTEALAQSRYLIVICSPAAARSRWVNEEIRQFKMMGGEGKILALIVDGEPNAADKPNSGLLECFPEALKYRVDASGNLTGQRVEPIAADIRRGRETRSIALLRLIAGLLGVPFDELRQRDKERNRRSLTLRFAALALIALLVTGGGVWKYRQDRMERLEDLGRDAMMQEQPVNAAVFLAEAYRMGNDSRDVRIMLEQAMRSVDMLTAVHSDDAEGNRSAVFSDDGTRIMASSKSGNITIWRADNGSRLLRLDAAKGSSSRRATFLPGSKEIAMVYDDGRVEIVDAKLGTPIRQARLPFEIHQARVVNSDSDRFIVFTDIAKTRTFIYDPAKMNIVHEISPACRTGGQLSGDSFYCLRDGKGDDVLSIYPLHSSAAPRQIPIVKDLYRFAIDAKAKRGTFSRVNGEAFIIDLQTGKQTVRVRHPGGIENVKFSSDGQSFATGGTTGTVLVWSSATGQLLINMPAHVGKVKDFHYLTESNRFVTLGEDGALKIWDAQTGAVLTVAQASHGFLTYTALSPDGNQLATFSRADSSVDLFRQSLDPALKMWNLNETGPTTSFGNNITAAQTFFDKRKSKVLFARKASPSTIWDTTTRKKLSEIPAYEGESNVSFNNDGSAVALAQGVFDVATGQQKLRFTGHAKTVEDISWSRDGQLVASGSSDSVRIWDLANGTLLHELSSKYGTVAAFSVDNKRVAVITQQGAVLFDIATGKQLAEYKSAEYRDEANGVWGIETIADGSRFRIGASNSMIEIDTLSAKVLRRVDNRPVYTGLSDCNQRITYTRRADKIILVSDLETGQVTATLTAPDHDRSTLDCNADGQLYVTGGRSGSAMLWNAKTSKPLLRFSGHTPQRVQVAFLPQAGQVLVAAGRDGIATKWTFEEETRSPAIISRRIACRVPLRLEGYVLRPNSNIENACARRRL